jgi:heme-degrading monooxygenase HmoA
MFARVLMTEAPVAGPDQAEAAIRAAREQAVPVYQKLPGFKGAYVLLDRETGKGGTVTLWETEANAQAVDAALAQVQAQATRQLNITQPLKSEIYEVAVQSPEGAPAAGAGGGIARVTTAQGSPDNAEASIRLVKEQGLPALQKLPGYRGTYYLVDRKRGKGSIISLWETEADAKAVDAAVTQQVAQATKELNLSETPRAGIYEVAVRA